MSCVVKRTKTSNSQKQSLIYKTHR